MANWYGTCRSNYFRVKDPNDFLKFLSDYECTSIEKEIEGETLYGFISDTFDGSIPCRVADEDDDYSEEISIYNEIHTHLAENEVCIIMEAGAEKTRYVTGVAMAIHSSGKQVSVALSDIYNLAEKTFGENSHITEASY